MTMKDESKRLELGSIMNIFIPNINAVEATDEDFFLYSYMKSWTSQTDSKGFWIFLRLQMLIELANATHFFFLSFSFSWMSANIIANKFKFSIQLLHVFRHAKCTLMHIK